MNGETLLEIIKETKIGQDPWYILSVDGKWVYGSYTLEKVMDVFNEIKEKKTPVNKKEILISEKI